MRLNNKCFPSQSGKIRNLQKTDLFIISFGKKLEILVRECVSYNKEITDSLVSLIFSTFSIRL